ncbi:MAG: RNA polymerase sigma factor [Verrucomicrobiales bacterium]|nr:RNA polymerase sigma factor [Verrucomicrobiales bacterium]
MDTTIDWDLILPCSGDSDRNSVQREDALIRAAAAGDEEAFRQLVQQYQDPVYRFAFQWLGNVEDAREVCQDTFVKIYPALRRYQRKGKFTTWLFAITLNLCRDRKKSKAYRQSERTGSFREDDSIDKEALATDTSPSETASRKDDIELMMQGIDLLPEKLKSTVILKGVEGLSNEECAEVLRCSPRAVEGRLYRAKQILSEWWKDQK